MTDVPDNYEIVGMQLRSSTEGLGSEANEIYNFDGDLGQADTSTTSFNGSTTDNDVFKIFDIGVVISSPEDQSATIEFDVTITDADGDTDTATFTVTLTDDGPVIGTTEIAVDEEGLDDGLAGTVYGDGSDLAGELETQSGFLTGLDFGVTALATSC